MKNIKHIYRLIAITLLFITYNTNAQQVNQNITGTYTGTWHYDSSNERFIVKIWQEGDRYYGNYRKVQLTNGVAGNVIYNSKITNEAQHYYNDSALYLGHSPQGRLSGFVYDNTIPGHMYKARSGDIKIKMTTMVTANGCNGCVVKASWKVTAITGGLIVGGPPPPFSIPLDIELTKVSNTITLD